MIFGRHNTEDLKSIYKLKKGEIERELTVKIYFLISGMREFALSRRECVKFSLIKVRISLPASPATTWLTTIRSLELKIDLF